ncbi:MAG: fasciclin domain-containing protein [Nocardioides sp.]|nr:fasciclin domain-containing protein [Nocardioides sp.]
MKHSVSTVVRLGLASLVAGALATTTAVPAQATGQLTTKRGDTSLATVLAADGNKFDKNWRDFDIVERAVLTVLEARPDSSVGLLTQGNKRATAFVPTDAAFRRLVTDVTGKRPKTERATFNAVASLVDLDTLEDVLLYHVVPGKTLGRHRVLAADGTRLTTALGTKVGVRVKGEGKRTRVVLVDRDRDATNPRVVVFNINKGNKQIAHGINRVLRPIDLP